MAAIAEISIIFRLLLNPIILDGQSNPNPIFKMD